LRELCLLSQKPLSRTTIPSRCMVNCVGVGGGWGGYVRRSTSLSLAWTSICQTVVVEKKSAQRFKTLTLCLSSKYYLTIPAMLALSIPHLSLIGLICKLSILQESTLQKPKRMAEFVTFAKCVAERENNHLSPSIISYCIEITEDKIYEG
jgi:hypothetical protein